MKEEQEWFRLKKVKTVQRLSICKMYTPRLRFCMCELCLTCKPVGIPDMVWYLQLFNDFLRFWIIFLRIDVIHHKLFPETLGRRKWGSEAMAECVLQKEELQCRKCKRLLLKYFKIVASLSPLIVSQPYT